MIETNRKARYRFRVEQGKTVDYYNEKGEGGRRPSAGFICPVRGARISSRYTGSRFHPILHCYRPHYGIDYAVRSGTPVRAAADGVIAYASWQGQFGRSVEIRHGAVSSHYAHLSGFGPGISVGKFVKQGTVIGYVGTTGLSTGPHLDYRMYKSGAPVNPATVTALPAPPPVANQKAFIAARDRYLPELKRELPLGPARPWTPPAAVAKAETD
jgi:murein DD-endopeptidase MepM/ murein hydrolase activator NlpD